MFHKRIKKIITKDEFCIVMVMIRHMPIMEMMYRERLDYALWAVKLAQRGYDIMQGFDFPFRSGHILAGAVRGLYKHIEIFG